MKWTREQEKFERQQEDILRLLTDAMETAEPGEWTAAQHVEHLALVDEEAARQAVRPSGKRRGSMTWLALPLVCLLLRFGPRVSIPSSLAMLEPRADVTPGEAAAHWTAARAQFRTQMDALSPADARRVVFRHPVAGPLDAAQMRGWASRTANITAEKSPVSRPSRRPAMRPKGLRTVLKGRF